MSELPTEMSGWREHVVVMFADLCDYTSISESIDPEEVDQLRRRLHALALPLIQSYGGMITQVYGDGILALFGYPHAHEDDARRAAEAALQLHELVRAAEWPERMGSELCLHTGIHGGLVFVREGDALHGRYDLTGDVVNTASRLSSAAGRDEILMSAAALAGVEGFFELETLPSELALKGKRLPLAAYRLKRRASVGTRYEARARRGLSAFVGRSAALEELLRATNGAAGGSTTATWVTGPAGIGKSRLLEELRARVAPEMLVLFGTCESFGELAPLEPFRQLLKSALDVAGRSGAELATSVRQALAALGIDREDEATALAALADAPVPSDVAKSAMEATARGLGRLIATLCRRSPVLLLLDDWQWADDSSRKVLDELMHERAQRPLAIVISARSLDLVQSQLAGARVLALEPFGEDESAQVILKLRPLELSPSVQRAIHRRAGGNPLFVEELCRSLPAQALADEAALEQFDAPTTLQGAIKARVTNLPAQHARVLRVASVIGLEFSLTLLSWVIQDEALPGLLGDLVAQDLIYLVGEASYRFKHGVARDVVYESILLSERRRIHGLLARGYTQSARPEHQSNRAEALAYHYRGSGDHERAAEYAELAGDKALLSSALDRARHQYAAAMQSLDRLPPSPEIKHRFLHLATRWAQACVYGPPREQVRLLERAAVYAEELGETGAQAQTQYMLGWIHYVLGDSGDAVAHYERALTLASAASAERLTEQLWANLGQSYAAACQCERALDYLSRAIEHKRKRAPHQGQRFPEGFSFALGCRAATHSYMGDFACADRDIAEALSIARDSGHPVEGSLYGLSAMVELHRENLQACREAAQRGRLIAERCSSAYVLAVSLSYENYAAYKLARSEEALQQLQRAVTYLSDHGLGLFISLSQACLADALLDAGDLAAAEAAARRTLACADPLGRAWALRTLAQVHARGAADERARMPEEVGEALRLADSHGSARERLLVELLALELEAAAPARGAEPSQALRALPSRLGAMGLVEPAERARSLLTALAVSAPRPV